MNMAKNYGPLAVASSTRCRVLSAGSSTERSYPGPLAHFSGRENSHPGDALVVGLLLILLFAGALLIPFERLIPQERNGKKSSRSTSTAHPRGEGLVVRKGGSMTKSKKQTRHRLDCYL